MVRKEAVVAWNLPGGTEELNRSGRNLVEGQPEYDELLCKKERHSGSIPL